MHTLFRSLSLAHYQVLLWKAAKILFVAAQHSPILLWYDARETSSTRPYVFLAPITSRNELHQTLCFSSPNHFYTLLCPCPGHRVKDVQGLGHRIQLLIYMEPYSWNWGTTQWTLPISS